MYKLEQWIEVSPDYEISMYSDIMVAVREKESGDVKKFKVTVPEWRGFRYGISCCANKHEIVHSGGIQGLLEMCDKLYVLHNRLALGDMIAWVWRNTTSY